MSIKRTITRVLCSIVAVGVISAQSFQLNYSTIPSFSAFFSQGPVMIVANILVVALINVALRCFMRQWRRTLLVTSTFFFLWSLVNFYVVQFHGSPLFISEFANFRTAINVLGGYHFFISGAVIGLFLVYLVEIALVFAVGVLIKHNYEERKQTLLWVAVLAVNALAVYFAFFSVVAIKPSYTMTWSWTVSVRQYGYVSCFLEDLFSKESFYIIPEGYSSEPLKAPYNTEIGPDNNGPDMILILNESFSDLNHFVENNCLAPLVQLENARLGYVAAPGVGGWTNNAEYELLTGNSSFLLKRSAPFNYVDFTATEEDVIKQLKKLGYLTCGMHCGEKSNYSRHVVYPKIGFDNIILGEDAFTYFNKYGARPWFDADNYRDLENYYEDNKGAQQFIYILTYQNHGGWEQNSSQYDTVALLGDYGDLSDDINEYLTSIQMSVDAFLELTEYFRTSDRHVIICMVGDHMPSFIKELSATEPLSSEKLEIARRLVPYVMWANYDVSFPENTDYASMTDLVPMLFRTAGLPLTPYFQVIMDLHDILPIRTSNGIWMDKDGNVGHYEESSQYYDLLKQYYYLEYNNIEAGNEYQKSLFEYQ